MMTFRPLKFTLAVLLALGQASFVLGGTVEFAAERPEQPSLRWRTRVVTVALSSSLARPASNVKSGSDLIGAVRRSLKAWEELGAIEFREVFSDKQSVSPQGAAGDGINLITVAPTAENALLFAKNAEEIAATTRVFFDGRGRISEADVVLNPYQQFSSDGTFGTFDLESTLTHEIGHVLGLEHSPVRGSTMYENFGKNGVFGLQGIAHRTLAETDRTAFRSKYGTVSAGDSCCGVVSVALRMPEGRPAADVAVWLEDTVTGKVVSQSVTGTDGAVDIGGIPAGSYTLFSARKERPKKAIPLQAVADVTVVPGEAALAAKRLEPGPDDIDLKYTGFNGQLTVSSVPINSGKSYTIYIGGRNLHPRSTAIRFNSPHLDATPGTLVSHDYGSDVTVLSFEVTVDSKAPVGEYTIFVESSSGGRSAAVGALSVRSFTNPFSNFVFDSK